MTDEIDSTKSPVEQGSSRLRAALLENQYWGHMKFRDNSISVKAVLAEIVCMTLFVYVGCGAAVFFSPGTAVTNLNAFYQNPPDGATPLTTSKYTTSTTLGQMDIGDLLKLQSTSANFGITVALTFGFTIAVLVYCVAHISGGQLNPAVSFGLFLTGKQGMGQCLANIVAQLIGSLLGSGFLYATVPGAPGPGNLGANEVDPMYNNGQAYLAEMCMTCMLVFTVLMTATDAKAVAKNMAPFVIGLSVFLAHCVLIPIDGCSINPARSFGPAAVAGHWRNFWVYWVGPLSGSFLAAIMHLFLTVWKFDTNFTGKKKEDIMNEVSNDNCGLDDAALRI